MEEKCYLCLDYVIIVLDKRTTTMIKTNRLLIDRFMFIAISDAGCSDIDNQCVMSPPLMFFA